MIVVPVPQACCEDCTVHTCEKPKERPKCREHSVAISGFPGLGRELIAPRELSESMEIVCTLVEPACGYVGGDTCLKKTHLTEMEKETHIKLYV